MIARTNDPLVSPVTASELADYLGLPNATDPSLDGILIGATSATIRFLHYDLITRDWTLTHWDWPYSGTKTRPTLSREPSSLDREIYIPYGLVTAVASVEIYGNATTNYVQRNDAIVFPKGTQSDEYKDNADPAIVVSYSAGFGATAADVPGAIKQGITMAAAFMYEHRGECEADQALKRSGAVEILQPFVNPRKMAVV
jgi:uncharacterized phiE125 gp8 family phage protein